MRVRTGVLPAMWALVLRRLFQAGGGVLNDGRVSEVVRPGIDIGPDGEDIVTGAWVLGAGVFGPGGLSVRRRLQKARARRPYEARRRGP